MSFPLGATLLRPRGKLVQAGKGMFRRGIAPSD